MSSIPLKYASRSLLCGRTYSNPHFTRAFVASYDTRNLVRARKQVERYSQMDQINVKIADLETVGDPVTPAKFLQYCQFIYHELPIRMARRIVDLEKMPFGLSEIEDTKKVRDWYLYSFLDIVSNPRPVKPTDAMQFADVLEQIYDRHSATLFTLSRGILTLKLQLEEQAPSKKREFKEIEQLGSILDEFYLSRIGIRTLLEHEQALRSQLDTPQEGYMGIINKNTSPYEVSKIAIDHANYVCNKQYGHEVPVLIDGCLNRTFSYIPNHLRHILFEILKNSMRATLEYHKCKDNDIPPIHIIIADGEKNTDVVIKISDQGGGIKRDKIDKIWNYFYTTNKSIHMDLLDQCRDFGIDSPMSGLGYGLPLSRLYARYFGGDLQMVSMEGYGTDCYIHLKRVGGEEISMSPSLHQ